MEKPIIYGQFNDCFKPIMDGVSETVRNYAYWLNKTSASTCVVTPSFPGYIDNEEFPVLRYMSVGLPIRSPYRIGFPEYDEWIVDKLKNNPFHLVHSHSPFSAGWFALNVARKQNIPIVASFHSKYKTDFESLIPNKTIVKLLVKNIVKFYESVDEVWIPQPSVEDTLRDYGYKGRVEIVNNGVDFEHHPNIEKFKTESKFILGIEPTKKVFLFVGQHIWEKNLKFLIKSLSLLRNENFVMYFVGEGYAKDEMVRMTEQLGLKDKVKFRGVISDRNQLLYLYAAADLFLFPSFYDNAPLVIREAAMMHTPSLLLKGSTASEIIIDNENGFLSENDAYLFATRINEIITKPKLLKKVGENSFMSICRPWKNIVSEVNDRYEDLIRRKRLLSIS